MANTDPIAALFLARYNRDRLTNQVLMHAAGILGGILLGVSIIVVHTLG